VGVLERQQVFGDSCDLGIHGVGDSLPNWHYEAFVAERYGDAEIGVLEGHAGLVVTAVQL